MIFLKSARLLQIQAKQNLSRRIAELYFSRRQRKVSKRGGICGQRGVHRTCYWDSIWAKQLNEICLTIGDNNAANFTRQCKLWRRRFRVPFSVFLDLVKVCKDELIFGIDSCKQNDICGNTICPVEIKLMGVLRVLGRGWCFDDVAEASKMSLSVAQRSLIQHHPILSVCSLQ